MSLKRVLLKNFRNYEYRDFKISKQFIVVEGRNGLGKTNLLEGLSLLQTQRGMKGCKLEETINFKNKNEPWVVFSEFQDGNTVGMEFDGDKRSIKINGKSTKGTDALKDVVRVFWISPQNDRLFVECPEKRRKFFDSIFSTIFPRYKEIKKQYEHYCTERSRLLKTQKKGEWIDLIEEKIIQTGLEFAEIRDCCLRVLNEHLKRLKYLSQVQITIMGDFFNLYKKHDMFLSEYKEKLCLARERDFLIGGCFFGPHKDDVSGFFLQNRGEIKFGSNGQQCISIMSVLIATLLYIYETEDKTNLLFLLDEIVMHLDFSNRMLLFRELEELLEKEDCFQIWITVSDKASIIPALKDYDLINLGVS